jgi:hypothetical protein
MTADDLLLTLKLDASQFNGLLEMLKDHEARIRALEEAAAGPGEGGTAARTPSASPFSTRVSAGGAVQK